MNHADEHFFQGVCICPCKVCTTHVGGNVYCSCKDCPTAKCGMKMKGKL